MWQEWLVERLEALGDRPSESQQQRLMSWIVRNVPEACWSSIAFELPGGCSTELSMRAAENGYG